MAKTYTVQVEYLLPVYKNVVVEAENEEEACQKALEDEGWGDAEECVDGSSPTYVVGIDEGDTLEGCGEPPERFVKEKEKDLREFFNLKD